MVASAADVPRARPAYALRVLSLVTIVGMIAVNIAANAEPFFGRNTGEISALYPTLVTPAGYVFAIWGLIYLGMLAFGIGQFFGPMRASALPDRLVAPVVLSNLANVGWLLLWHSLNIVWTLPLMLVLLGSLIWAYLIIRRTHDAPRTGYERWTVWRPFSLYLGWVSVATIANVSNVLVATHWNGFGIPPAAWAVVVLLVGAGLAVLGLVRERDTVFAGVFVWALVGIGVARAGGSALVSWVAFGLAALVALGIVVALAARPRR